MPLFQVTFRKKLNDQTAHLCQEYYDVEHAADVIDNVRKRYEDRAYDILIERVGSNSKASTSHEVSGLQRAMFGDGNEA